MIGSRLANVLIFAILAFSVTAIAITALVIGYLEKRESIRNCGKKDAGARRGANNDPTPPAG